jgi:hypothetical protein
LLTRLLVTQLGGELSRTEVGLLSTQGRDLQRLPAIAYALGHRIPEEARTAALVPGRSSSEAERLLCMEAVAQSRWIRR